MDADVIIIGAGVIGLAIAKSALDQFDTIFLLEKNENFGLETSSRNSEVIHSGIYYQPDSLKSKLCVKGRELLYEFCENYGIKYNKCGKLVIKQSFNNDDDFDEIIYNANKNGVRNFELNQKEVEEIEPEIYTKGAISFPDSGVFDSHAFMRTLEHQISKKVDLVYKTEVKEVKKIEDGYLIKIKNPSGELDEITRV